MSMPIEAIIFYILLIDSLAANLLAWNGGGTKWYQKNFRLISRYFPITKGWTSYYLILVLFIGWILIKYNAL